MNISILIVKHTARRSYYCCLCITVVSGLFFSTAQAEKLPPDAVKRIMNGTVYIESYGAPVIDPGAREQVIGSGTGFIVDDSGLVLTNAHVVAPVVYWDFKEKETISMRRIRADKEIPSVSNVMAYQRTRITVRLRSGRRDSKVFDAQLIAMRWEFGDLYKGRDRDFALLRISADEPLVPLSAIDEENDEPVSLLEDVWSFGFPHGRDLAELSGNPNGPDLSVRGGEITALRHDSSQALVKIEHNCGTEGGNSGGPMVNSKGQVVGINTWSYGTHSKFALPIDMGSHWWWFALDRSQNERAAKRRNLRVDPKDDTAYPTIAAALKEIGPLRKLGSYSPENPGHTIQLSSGRHIVASDHKVEFDKNVHIRGQGIDKTTLVLEQSFPQSYGNGPYWAEISDMTIETGRKSQLEFVGTPTRSAGTWVLHDIAIRRRESGAVVVIGKTARVSMFNCRFLPDHGGINPDIVVKGSRFGSSSGGRLRMQGVRNCALVVDNQGHLTAEGCQFNRIFKATGDLFDDGREEWWQPLLIAHGCDIHIEGCNFDVTTSQFPRELEITKKDPFGDPYKGKHIHICSDCNLNLVGNHFANDIQSKYLFSGGIQASKVVDPNIYLNNFWFLNATGQYFTSALPGKKSFVTNNVTALVVGMKDPRRKLTRVHNNFCLNSRISLRNESGKELTSEQAVDRVDEEYSLNKRNEYKSTAIPKK